LLLFNGLKSVVIISAEAMPLFLLRFTYTIRYKA